MKKIASTITNVISDGPSDIPKHLLNQSNSINSCYLFQCWVISLSCYLFYYYLKRYKNLFVNKLLLTLIKWLMFYRCKSMNCGTYWLRNKCSLTFKEGFEKLGKNKFKFDDTCGKMFVNKLVEVGRKFWCASKSLADLCDRHCRSMSFYIDLGEFARGDQKYIAWLGFAGTVWDYCCL